jgi:hypothetical protein
MQLSAKFFILLAAIAYGSSTALALPLRQGTGSTDGSASSLAPGTSRSVRYGLAAAKPDVKPKAVKADRWKQYGLDKSTEVADTAIGQKERERLTLAQDELAVNRAQTTLDKAKVSEDQSTWRSDANKYRQDTRQAPLKPPVTGSRLGGSTSSAPGRSRRHSLPAKLNAEQTRLKADGQQYGLDMSAERVDMTKGREQQQQVTLLQDELAVNNAQITLDKAKVSGDRSGASM